MINGAGDCVGTFGVKIAKQYGVEVTGVDYTAKLNMMRQLGFDQVIDYTKVDFTKAKQQYDLILDVKTSRPVYKFLRALKPGGLYITVGGSLQLLFHAIILMPFIEMFSKKRIGIAMLKPNKDLTYTSGLF